MTTGKTVTNEEILELLLKLGSLLPDDYIRPASLHKEFNRVSKALEQE